MKQKLGYVFPHIIGDVFTSSDGRASQMIIQFFIFPLLQQSNNNITNAACCFVVTGVCHSAATCVCNPLSVNQWTNV